MRKSFTVKSNIDLMDNRDFKGLKFFLVVGVVFFIFFLFLSSFGCFVLGQSEISFTTTDKFEIPLRNGSVSFGVEGSCEKAFLENYVWNFVNLCFVSSQSAEKLDLKVSAKDCEITISSCIIYNSTFAGESARSARVRYNVVGNGEQVFDLGLDPKFGDWGVFFDGDFKGENDGWRLSSDGTLIVTGITGNVTLSYYGFPASFRDSFGGDDQVFSFHSVVVITSFALVFIVLLATVVRIRRSSNNLLISSSQSKGQG